MNVCQTKVCCRFSSIWMRSQSSRVLSSVKGESRKERKIFVMKILFTFRWNKIIIGSTKTMQRFVVSIRPHSTCNITKRLRWYSLLSKIRCSKRKLVNISLCWLGDDDWSDKKLTKTLREHHHSLRSVTLELCETLSPQMLMKSLSTIPLLESVALRYCKFDPIPDNAEVISLPNIKHLTIFETNLEVLQLFLPSKLISLDVLTVRSELELVRSFVSSHAQLERIHLKLPLESMFSNFFTGAPMSFSAKLKYLSLQSTQEDRDFPQECEENLMAFLDQRGSNLREIDLTAVISPSLFIFITTKLKRLQKLTGDMCKALEDESLYPEFSESSEIKSLTTANLISSDNEIGSYDSIGCLSRVGREYSFEYQSLHRFIREERNVVNNIGLLLERNPELERLVIQNFNFGCLGRASTLQLIKTLTESKSLKVIELGGRRLRMGEFYKLCKTTRWKSLEAMKISIEPSDQFVLKKVRGKILTQIM